MKKVVVASSNPVKIEAVQGGFSAVFGEGAHRVEGRKTSSGVSDQPRSDQEALIGARNRAVSARERHQGADFWVGIEGGIQDSPDGMEAFAWIVVQGAELTGEARTGTFRLPPQVARLVRSGLELGEADDLVFGRTNSKQKDGAVGILTGGLIDRAGYYKQAVVLALVPFINPSLYESQDSADPSGPDRARA